MAYIGMTCTCGAEYSFDFDEDATEGTEFLYFAHRFANTHKKCGYMNGPEHHADGPPAPGQERGIRFDKKDEEKD